MGDHAVPSESLAHRISLARAASFRRDGRSSSYRVEPGGPMPNSGDRLDFVDFFEDDDLAYGIDDPDDERAEQEEAVVTNPMHPDIDTGAMVSNPMHFARAADSNSDVAQSVSRRHSMLAPPRAPVRSRGTGTRCFEPVSYPGDLLLPLEATIEAGAGTGTQTMSVHSNRALRSFSGGVPRSTRSFSPPYTQYEHAINAQSRDPTSPISAEEHHCEFDADTTASNADLCDTRESSAQFNRESQEAWEDVYQLPQNQPRSSGIESFSLVSTSSLPSQSWGRPSKALAQRYRDERHPHWSNGTDVS
jgi:hypothetical protein